MNDEQFNQLKSELKSHVEDTIRVVVNGKIDSLRKDFSNYVADDMQWKEEAQPLVDAFKGGSWFIKSSSSILKFVILVGTAIGSIIVIKKYLPF